MATGENRVEWPLIEPGTYEDMVAVLLSHLHPGLVRIDGKGGDGGRDCYWDTDSGREAFELKSFTGRMTKTRRRQVKRSLSRAAKHKPSIWHLVVPIDPSPSELTWFDSLKAQYSFPLDWLGRTWLDGEMAKRAYIARYFIEGSADEVLSRLAEFEKEQAALAAGVPDALDRLQSISDRLQEIDPYYEFNVEVAPEGSRIGIRPRYAGAENDRPVTGRINGEFPATDEGQRMLSAFQEAIDFGLPFDLAPQYVRSIDLDAPAGIGGTIEDASLSFRPLDSDLPAMSLRAQVSAPTGSVLAGLPLTVMSRTSGLGGIQLTARDRSGWLTVTIRIKYSDRSIHFTYRTQLTDPALPIDLSPALAFVAALHKPNLLTVKIAEPAMTLVDQLPIDAQPIMEAGQRKVIDDLATLQHASGIHFELPESLSQRDLREIDEGSRLLAGEAVPMRWPSVTIHLRPEGDEPAVVREAAVNGQTVSLVTQSEVAVEVAGHILTLGGGNVVYPAMKITNSEEMLRKWDAREQEIVVELECLQSPVMSLGQLNTTTNPEPGPQLPSPPSDGEK